MDLKLFDGEVYENREEEIEELRKYNDEEINMKYISGDIRIVTEQARYPLSTILEMITEENSKYKLNPDYQRRRRWDDTKKSRLIESIIINVPIPPIFLYEYEFAKFEVMDGLQRLTTICDFYSDKFKLEGLEQWSELNGKTYSELPTKIREGIDRRYLSSIILLYETGNNNEQKANFLKKLVFERLNSGGVKLSYQESRNALYNGPFNELCIKLSRNKYFCIMWNIPTDEEDSKLTDNDMFKCMDDVELVLRFFALRLLETRNDVNSWKNYFDSILREGNKLNSEILTKYNILFNDTMKLIYDVLGENAFYLFRLRNGKWYWLERPTKVVYDPIVRVFSQLIDKKDILIQKKVEIQSKIEKFYMDNYDDFEGRNNNKVNIIKRTNLIYDFISEFLE